MPHGRSPTHARKRSKRRSAMPPEMPLSGPVRLQKVLASAGIASRRGAEELIRAGRVQVNGRRASLGDSADPSADSVTLDGERVGVEPASYWMLHKPVGVVTSMSDPHGRKTVMHLMPAHAGRLHPVGRLDRDSAGLLLMTNDGALTQVLLHPAHESEKEYRVTVKGEVGEPSFERLRRGLHLDDGRTAQTRVSAPRYDSAADATTFRLVMTEGRKRQIRRMMLSLGHPVKKLLRVRVGPIGLGRLAPGAARALRPHEIRALKAHAEKLRPSRRSRAAAHRRRGAAPA
jgi:23S rRNA pseudouridine2605 synthase